MELKELLAAAPRKVVRETFSDGDLAFVVELRLCSRADLESMRKRATKRVLDRGTRQFRDDLDLAKLREYLRDNCINDWSDLTFAKAAALCNRTLSDGLLAERSKPVACTEANKDVMLQEALGFEDWVWEKVTNLAAEREGVEMGEERT